MVKYCSECGEKNEDDAAFCRMCGHDLNPKNKKENSIEKNSKTDILYNNWKKIIIALGIIIIIAGASYYAYDAMNFKTFTYSNWSVKYPANGKVNVDNPSSPGLITFYNHNGKEIGLIFEENNTANSSQELEDIIKSYWGPKVKSVEEVTINGQKAYKANCIDVGSNNRNLTIYQFPNKHVEMDIYPDFNGSQILVDSIRFN